MAGRKEGTRQRRLLFGIEGKTGFSRTGGGKTDLTEGVYSPTVETGKVDATVRK